VEARDAVDAVHEVGHVDVTRDEHRAQCPEPQRSSRDGDDERGGRDAEQELASGSYAHPQPARVLDETERSRDHGSAADHEVVAVVIVRGRGSQEHESDRQRHEGRQPAAAENRFGVRRAMVGHVDDAPSTQQRPHDERRRQADRQGDARYDN
jgi:hypothetical protein